MCKKNTLGSEVKGAETTLKNVDICDKCEYDTRAEVRRASGK